MQYTPEVTINAPRAKVVELFTDPAHFTDWQPGLECYELVSGEQAQTGASRRAHHTSRQPCHRHDRDRREQLAAGRDRPSSTRPTASGTATPTASSPRHPRPLAGSRRTSSASPACAKRSACLRARSRRSRSTHGAVQGLRRSAVTSRSSPARARPHLGPAASASADRALGVRRAPCRALRPTPQESCAICARCRPRTTRGRSGQSGSAPGRTARPLTSSHAIADRRIVRTWPMRGTLHFVAPEDVRWMLALLSPRVIARARTRHEQLGITCRDDRAREVALRRRARRRPRADPRQR